MASWQFECWNEPDLEQPLVGGFWTGSQLQYFQMYDATARALKAVSPRIRIGGPASSVAPSWVARHYASRPKLYPVLHRMKLLGDCWSAVAHTVGRRMDPNGRKADHF